MGRGNFEGREGASHCKIGTLCGHLCKNSRTDLDAVWVVGSDGPKESSVRRGFRSPMGRGNSGERGAHSKV